MTKLRTKLILKTIGESGISMDMTMQKGSTLLNVILTMVKFIPMDLELAQTKINETINKELQRRIDNG